MRYTSIKTPIPKDRTSTIIEGEVKRSRSTEERGPRDMAVLLSSIRSRSAET